MPPSRRRSNLIFILTCATIRAALTSQLCHSATFEVPVDYPGIQLAIDAASSGDSILVAPGTYIENLKTHGKYLSILSTSGPDLTIIDGNYAGTVIEIDGGGLIESFTITRGAAQCHGGGINVLSTPDFHDPGPTTIRNNVISNCATGFKCNGGGVSVAFLAHLVVLENNYIHNNAAGNEGGGIYADITFVPIEVIRNRVQHNSAAWCGGGASTAIANYSYNVFTNNSSGGPGGGICASSGSIIHNTIVSNTTTSFALVGAGIAARSTTILSNIVTNNHRVGPSPGSGAGISSDRAPQLACNDSWGNDIDFHFLSAADTSGMHNFSADPQFCSPGEGDFRLSPGSPAAYPLGCGGPIGALPVELSCAPTATRRTTWGTLKLLYRGK